MVRVDLIYFLGARVKCYIISFITRHEKEPRSGKLGIEQSKYDKRKMNMRTAMFYCDVAQWTRGEFIVYFMF